MSQDPTSTDPGLYKVVFENDRVRSWSTGTALGTGPIPMATRTA